MRLALTLAVLLVGVVPVSAHADGDAAAGKSAFASCAICHGVTPGAKMLGPTLWGVVGRPTASVEEYAYSSALKGLNQTWTPELIDQWLQGPQKLVPGTKMSYPGIADPVRRQNVIAYLETLK